MVPVCAAPSRAPVAYWWVDDAGENAELKPTMPTLRNVAPLESLNRERYASVAVPLKVRLPTVLPRPSKVPVKVRFTGALVRAALKATGLASAHALFAVILEKSLAERMRLYEVPPMDSVELAPGSRIDAPDFTLSP